MCRIRYKKTGRMKFLSHLETMKAWERALRRAQIDLLYSAGYNPRPQMSFALPTAVGTGVLSGYMDLKVREGSDLQRLRALDLPGGFAVLDVKEVEDSRESLMSRVHSADYLIQGDPEPLKRLESDLPLPFVRVTKRRSRQERDARDYIAGYALEGDVLRIRLLAGSEQSIRVSELLETLSGEADAHFRYEVTLTEIYDKEGRSLWEP